MQVGNIELSLIFLNLYNRDALQKLAEFGEKQQAELLKKQEQIQHAHDRLIQNSQSILSAQVCTYPTSDLASLSSL